MVFDVELTLNRWGWGFVASNKLQLGCVRLSLWRKMPKVSISFEVNWKL